MAISIAGAAPAPALAQWQYGGVSICDPACFGYAPLLTSDASGGGFITWIAINSVTAENVYATRLTGSGLVAPGWDPGRTPVSVEDDSQLLVDAIPDGGGGLYVLWSDFRGTANHDLYAQHLLADGTIAPGWIVNGTPVCTAVGPQESPQIVLDGAGGIFVVWEDKRVDAGDVYMQHLTADGSIALGWIVDGLPVDATVDQQGPTAALADGAGGLYVAVSDQGGERYDTYLLHVEGDGSPVPGWPLRGIPVATTAAPETPGQVIVSDGAGGVFITWSVGDAVAIQTTILAQHVLPDGSIAPGWPEGGMVLCDAPGIRGIDREGMVADGTGGFIAAWGDYRDLLNGLASDIYGLRVRFDGTRVPGWIANGNPLVVSPNYDQPALIANDGQDGMYIAFTQQGSSGQVVATQHITPGGQVAPGWPLQGIPVYPANGGAYPTIVAAEPGAAIVAWSQSLVGLRAQKLIADGPVPVQASLVTSEATPERVSITWELGEGLVSEVVVERRTEAGSWQDLGSLPVDGLHRVVFEDTDVASGDRYGYRIGWDEAGITRYSGETWIEVPAAYALALEGMVPNPARGGALTIAFSLPSAAPATLDLIDLAGRRVARRELAGLTPGRHVVRMDGAAAIAPGVYFVRLTHEGRVLGARGVVVR